MLIHHPKQLDYLISFSLPISLLIFASLTPWSNYVPGAAHVHPPASCLETWIPSTALYDPKRPWDESPHGCNHRPYSGMGCQIFFGEKTEDRGGKYLKNPYCPYWFGMYVMRLDHHISILKARPAIWNRKKVFKFEVALIPWTTFDHSLRLPHVGDLLSFCSAC